MGSRLKQLKCNTLHLALWRKKITQILKGYIHKTNAKKGINEWTKGKLKYLWRRPVPFVLFTNQASDFLSHFPMAPTHQDNVSWANDYCHLPAKCHTHSLANSVDPTFKEHPHLSTLPHSHLQHLGLGHTAFSGFLTVTWPSTLPIWPFSTEQPHCLFKTLTCLQPLRNKINSFLMCCVKTCLAIQLSYYQKKKDSNK